MAHSPHKPSQMSPNSSSMKTLSVFCIFVLFSFYFFSTFPKLRLYNNTNQTRVHDLYKNSIKVPHEVDHKTNISHILFGVSGSAKTWSRRRRYCELWWKPNATRGFVWLDEEPPEASRDQWPETSPPYRVSADTARLKYSCPYGSRSAVRIARIVKESFELGLENVRWLVMGDDDTVFFTENLVSVLSKYDHKEMYYIGGISESVDQDVIHSYTMAYGGGGFAVSRPLAAELVRILDGCIDRYAAFYGSDQKVGACMAEIGVPLTRELGFHQLDIRGSAYGLLSAHPLAPLVSLHHLDSLHPLFPGADRVSSVKKLMTAHDTDPGRVLQQTLCYDPTRNWSVSVAWGYNVQLYPFLVTPKDLSTPLQTFLTWAWKPGPFTFDTRALSLDRCERPVVFHYSGRAEELKDGQTLTRYPRNSSVQLSHECKRDDYEAAYLVKGFNVYAPIQLWNNKAPRRQCCRINSGSSQQNDYVSVKISVCDTLIREEQ